jgi:hypothetical protein
MHDIYTHRVALLAPTWFLSLSLPSSPPWLGALFNGFCQGFIIKIPSLNKTVNHHLLCTVGS